MPGIGDRLKEAGQLVRDAAARLAGEWSPVRLPSDIEVRKLSDTEVIVVAGSTRAPMAYPNELGVRHPVFASGPRSEWTWVKGNDRPFLRPALEDNADKAAAIIARAVDDWAHAAGFEGTG